MPATIRFDELHQGPPTSAHGGTAVARLAAHVPGGVAGGVSVRLLRPPPLDRELTVRETDGGLALVDGEEPIALAHAAALALDAAPPPPVADARAAAATSWMNDAAGHPFPRCFGCGPLAPPEALHLRPGPVDDARHACVWRPPADVEVDAVLVLAALDCPSCAPVERVADLDGPFVLGTMHGRVDGLPAPGTEHVVSAWLLGREGRKVRTAAALHAPDGALLAAVSSVWVSLRPAA